MVPLFGMPQLSRTMPSPNLSVIPKANENTDLARTATVARRARARNGRTAIRNWTTPLPRHERRRAGSQNARTGILTANQSENDRNPRLATMTVTKMMRKTGRRNERNVPSQGRKNRKAGSSLRTSLPPPRPTLVPNPTSPPGVVGPGVNPPSRDRNQKPPSPLKGRHPLYHSRSTITRARGPAMYTGR